MTAPALRILLAPIGSSGDVMPLVALGRALRDDGHQVSACATRDFRAAFHAAGIEFFPIEIDAVALAGSLDGGIVSILGAGRRLRPVADTAMVALDEACRAKDVVVGAGLQLFAPMFCEARGIRYVYASSGPTNERAAGLPPHYVPLYGLGAAGNRALWAAQDFVFGRLFGAIARRGQARAGLGASKTRFWDSITAPPTVLGLYDAPIVGSGHRGAEPLGACLPGGDAPPLDARVETFLAAGAPPVFVGFGSMPAKDPAARTALVLGALEATGQRGILDPGWGAMVARDDDGRVCWVDGSSFRRLMGRVTAIVHHGGAGTTATAARAGIPQVVVPHITDNFYFGRRVAALGIGPRPLPVKRLSTRRLQARIGEALGDTAMTARAVDLSNQLRATDGARNAAGVLSNLLRSKNL